MTLQTKLENHVIFYFHFFFWEGTLENFFFCFFTVTLKTYN